MFCIDKKLLKCIGFSLTRVAYFFAFHFIYRVVFTKLGGVRNVGGLVIDHSTGNIFYASDNNIYVTTSSGNVYRKLLSGVNIGSLQVDSKRG